MDNVAELQPRTPRREHPTERRLEAWADVDAVNEIEGWLRDHRRVWLMTADVRDVLALLFSNPGDFDRYSKALLGVGLWLKFQHVEWTRELYVRPPALLRLVTTPS